jgi:hypothetical protein
MEFETLVVSCEAWQDCLYLAEMSGCSLPINVDEQVSKMHFRDGFSPDQRTKFRYILPLLKRIDNSSAFCLATALSEFLFRRSEPSLVLNDPWGETISLQGDLAEIELIKNWCREGKFFIEWTPSKLRFSREIQVL